MDNFLNKNRLAWAVGILAAAWAEAHVFYSRPFGDEGWYLYAAGNLLRGRWPFLHAFYTQGPLSALVTAPVMFLAPGLISARLQAAFFLMGALFLGGYFLASEKREPGIAWWLALVGLNGFTVSMSTLAITTAPELFAIILSLVLLQRKKPAAAVFISALAVTLRISLAPWAAAVWLFAVLAEGTGRRKAAFRLAGYGAIPFLLVLGPFLIAAPHRLWDGLIAYHMHGVQQAITDAGGWSNRGRFWHDGLILYLPALALALLGGLITRRRPFDSMDALLLGTAALMEIGQTLPALPNPKYHVIPMALVALFASRRIAMVRIPRALAVPLVLVLALWQPGGLDFWEQIRPGESGAPARHRQIAREIGTLAPSGQVLTFETSLAVEGGWLVPRGYEMGPFSLAVTWDEDRIRADGMVSPARVLADLESGAYPVLALYEDDLGFLAPEQRRLATESLLRRYRMVRSYKMVGQHAKTLFVFARRDP